jgi:hypothetical protein
LFGQRGERRFSWENVVEPWHEDARSYPALLGGGSLAGAAQEATRAAKLR